MKKEYVVGDKYMIQFWDHCLGEDKIKCEVTIYITKEDKTHVYGTWWRIIDSEDDPIETEETNREPVSIVKSTVTKKRKYRTSQS